MIFLLLLLFQGVDLVTEADTRVEKVITQMIKGAFPNDIIIGEEDQAESAAGKQDDLFPTGRIWCGELLQLEHVICIL
jgi:fructose-1,6-bisphosphatase/inositol monophosphatase family enzyme